MALHHLNLTYENRDKGVCGIARFPSVALGASLIPDTNLWQSDRNQDEMTVPQSRLSLSSAQSVSAKPTNPFRRNYLSDITTCFLFVAIGTILILYRHFSQSREKEDKYLPRKTQLSNYGSINTSIIRT
jgi:hypothetical protein